MTQLLLDGAVDDRESVGEMKLPQLVDRAVALLKQHEPQDGYYLAFSGGKDSVCCKRLLQLSGVKFDGWYNNVTIDPPELVRFVKREHADCGWNNQQHSMMHAVANVVEGPPTRIHRWCCQQYKETGGYGRSRVIGVRAAESARRAVRWQETTEHWDGSAGFVCPIVYWTDAHVWGFIRDNSIPYCELYDQGFSRLGCVGCPMGSCEQKRMQFARWPRYEANWRRAVMANWTKWHAIPRRDGKPRAYAKFPDAETFYSWWLSAEAYAPTTGSCMSESLFTNE